MHSWFFKLIWAISKLWQVYFVKADLCNQAWLIIKRVARLNQLFLNPNFVYPNIYHQYYMDEPESWTIFEFDNIFTPIIEIYSQAPTKNWIDFK